MGVTRLWEEFAPQKSVSLAKLSQECMEKNGRPLRLAVDVFPRIFGDKGTTDAVRDSGGMNHAAKNVFYFALHFLEAGVQPIFVYDGPNKPSLKRGEHHTYSSSNLGGRLAPAVALSSSTRTQADKDRDQSVEHVVRLTKDVFDAMGLPWLDAAGEGEAECCALERLGLVDGVVTTDGDAFVFGGQNVLRLCNKKANETRRAEVYDAYCTALGSTTGTRPTRGYFLLLALVAGGDYANGLPGCGPHVARRLYREFGTELDKIVDSNAPYKAKKVGAWSRQLPRKLEGCAFADLGSLIEKLSEGFDQNVLQYYVSPAVHSESELRKLVHSRTWTKATEIEKLRELTKKYFDWKGRDYARKFANILGPPLLAKCLMNKGLGQLQPPLQKCQLQLLKKRNTKDEASSIKVSYHPEKLLGLNLSGEPDLPGYTRDFKFDPSITQPCFTPEWLIEYGARTQYEEWRHHSQGKKQPRKKGKKRALSEIDDVNVTNGAKPPQKKLYKSKSLSSALPSRVPDKRVVQVIDIDDFDFD
ncbi:hypothetical protein H2200_012745 [Cladophialophora chaetospira]|uniref:XPG-I domain-containing protein n=1 Tax=Cladophialophora chaetospira TaxID=386627 RepID=A0AA38WXH8_9EURO|nr:hypothetical protein H2200_012745 [Cladophialophora chaetospira]